MEHSPLGANLTVAEVLARWPQTIPVFIHRRMACVGCVMAPFETLAEVALVYHLDLDYFLKELQQAIIHGCNRPIRRRLMKLIDDLLTELPNGPVQDVRIGAFWTAVVVDVAGQRCCGLASTLREDDHHHGGGPAVPAAGRLLDYKAQELAKLAHSASPMEAALGIAAINALLPRHEELWTDLNAEEVIVQYGQGKRVALVGHFPFIPRLRREVGTLWVLEQEPRGEDLPAEFAARVLPQADVIALTGTTFINHTFAELMALRRPEAVVMVLGPSTPLSPRLFEHGVHLLSGAVVEDVEAVLRAVSQGANFRQLHHQGVRLVTMQKSSK